MAQRLTSLSFIDWLDFVFEHPASGPEWYWADDAPFWDGPPAMTADYVTRLFEAPLPLLDRYSDAQLNLGLSYLISPGLGEHMLCLAQPQVTLAARRRCVRACLTLFRELFMPRCSPHLSHRDEPGAAPLNAVCYMWWDAMPVHGGPDPADRLALRREVLETMMQILRLDSLACQESALHGLGHNRQHFPAEVEAGIDDFLRGHPNVRAELAIYARSARGGCVL